MCIMTAGEGVKSLGFKNTVNSKYLALSIVATFFSDIKRSKVMYGSTMRRRNENI